MKTEGPIIQQLILDYHRKLLLIKSEINDLCSINTHPDDLELCNKLNVKLKCYEDFIADLKRL